MASEADPWLLACSWAERAIANAWSSSATPRHARELRRLLTRFHGAEHGFPSLVDARVAALESRWRARGGGQPPGSARAVAALERELGLDAVAADILLAVVAVELPEWGELTQLFHLLAELVGVDPAMAPCEYLLHELFDGTWSRAEISAALDDDSPLLASGAVACAGRRPFASLRAAPAVVARLRGRAPASQLPVDRILPSRAHRVDAAPEEVSALDPRALRVAVRGASYPRRACLRSIATRLGRPIAVLDADHLHAMPPSDALACLRHVHLGGDIPAIDSGDGAPAPAGYGGPLVWLLAQGSPPREGALELVVPDA